MDSDPAAKEELIFGAVQDSFGDHPEFGANSGPIRDAIRAVVANPRALAPFLTFIAKFVPGTGGVILNGVIALLNVLPAQTATGDAGSAVIAPRADQLP